MPHFPSLRAMLGAWLIACPVVFSFPVHAVEPLAAYIFPAGGQRGTTVPVRVGGCYFHGEAGFEMLGAGVAAPARIKETNTVWFEGPVISQPASQRSEDYPRDHAAVIRIAADAPAGLRHWRAWTSQGATPAMKFVVGELPEIVELEAEGEPLPVLVKPPLTINGRIFPREDVDVWSFQARAGQAFTITVAAQSLGSPLQSRLIVFDADGQPITEALATQRGDPTLHFTAPRDGTYSVRIDDVNAGGLQNHVYRLTITDQPVLTRSFPLGGRRGEPLKLELAGHDLPINVANVQLPATAAGTARVPVQAGGKALGTVALEADVLPEFVHSSEAHSFTAPCTLNGRILSAGSTNVWRFEAKKGEVLEFTLAAARLGSSLTPQLQVTGTNGATLARSEAAPGEPADLNLSFKAPADGEYFVRVSERFSSRGGPDFAYRLRVAPPPEPDFQLSLAGDVVVVVRETVDGEQLAPGKPKRGSKQPTGKLKVSMAAVGGFKGDIELVVEGLPANVKASGTKIASGRATADLAFAAEHAAKIGVAHLTVRGTATINGTPVTRTAALPTGRGEPAIESVLLAVAMPTPFKNTSDFLMTIAQRGSICRRPYNLERGGFTGPLIARLADRQGRHLQGVTAPPVHIPADATQFEFAVHLAPGMELGRTSRSQIMLLGTVRDHDGSEHIVSYSQNEQNDQVIAITQTGLLEVELDQPAVRVVPGGSVKIPFHLRREKSIAGEAVRVELQPPVHVRGVRSASVTIPGGSLRGVLEVFFSADSGPFNLPFPIRATTLNSGDPHTAEAFVEFISPRTATRTARAEP